MKMNKHLIIDGNNLLHRTYHRFKNLSSQKGKKSSIVFGFTHVLQSLIRTHKPDEVLVLFDGGRSKRRLEILPEYKQRTKKEDFDYEDFIEQKATTEKILETLGIPYARYKDVEADDLVYLHIRKLKRDRRNHIVIVSSDKDFHQLLGPKVSQWHPTKNKRITYKNVLDEYGYEAHQCVDYLILDGDSSDNIPGYPGVGPKTAIKFLNKYGSIKEYLYSLTVEEDKKIKKRELEELFLRNRELIDIRYFCRSNNMKLKDYPLVSKKGNKIDKKELAIICSRYNITTFTKPEFLSTFQRLLK